jgi:hypothetical protein
MDAPRTMTAYKSAVEVFCIVNVCNIQAVAHAGIAVCFWTLETEYLFIVE